MISYSRSEPVEASPRSEAVWMHSDTYEDIALNYHDRTKHDYFRSARSLGFMDWDTQPDPFLRYQGADLTELPIPDRDRTPQYDQIYRYGVIPPCRVDLHSISSLFYYSMAISAWKTIPGASWSLRVNPSSGNLHPSEAYLVLHALEGMHGSPAVYHYAPREHGLERRTEFDDDVWDQLTEGFGPHTFFVGLSSIHWRESWKYGERAYRYCQHDVGHALAALRISAAMLGWGLRVVSRATDAEISQLLGLAGKPERHPEEREEPAVIAVVYPDGETLDSQTRLSKPALDTIARGPWFGQPNPLSSDHHEWPIIDAVAQACRAPSTHDQEAEKASAPPVRCLFRPNSGQCRWLLEQTTEASSGSIVRQRRSAVAMDGTTALDASRVFAMLGRLLPEQCFMPWDSVSWPTSIDLGLFVHRVRGLDSGLYALVRDPDRVSRLREAMSDEFSWTRPEGAPEELPLFMLATRDVRSVASSVSCGQSIAGEGAFSLGMLADFQGSIRRHGAQHYRRLFWETGVIGQVLYLEAEAAGVRSTGIGCFFDDPVHQVFGLKDHTFQTLYHFTVGGPVEDGRLTTLPAYGSAP